MKSSEVSIKTRSTPASLTIQGQVTKDTTVKWSIGQVEIKGLTGPSAPTALKDSIPLTEKARFTLLPLMVSSLRGS